MPKSRSEGRQYRSPVRAERRNQTQLALLDAAEALFKERGYAATSMRAVAELAGVSLPTVYLYFRSKPALVRALADRVTGSSDLDVSAVLVADEPLRMLELGAANLRRLHERSQVIASVLAEGSAGDRELLDEWRRWQRQHLDAMRAVAGWLVQRGALRQGLDAAAAADVLYTLGSVDVFRHLVVERGWPASRYEGWLVESGRLLLLA